MKLTMIPILVVAFLFAGAAQAEIWKPLFNGEDLDGWHVIGNQTWTVENGSIVGRQTVAEPGWLVTEKTYSDFVLRFRFKWHGGDSGIQFRTRVSGDQMIGYQANLDFERDYATGSLLRASPAEAQGSSTKKKTGLGSTVGTGLRSALTGKKLEQVATDVAIEVLTQKTNVEVLKESALSAEKLLKKDQWNTYEISAIGDHIQIHVNGEKTTDTRDRNGPTSGIIALQMVPGVTMKGHIEWTDIRILEIGNKADWKSLFNGRSLSGWKEIGDSTWKVDDGAIVGKSKGGGYGWLISRDEYADFHASIRFRMKRGNSGIQFRSWRVDDMVHGFQADLASDSDWISGHLYDQGEVGVLVKPDQDFSKIIDYDGWNTYEITAIGPDVELFVNGVKSIQHSDPERLKGIFAFQIHSGQEMETGWKDIRILEF